MPYRVLTQTIEDLEKNHPSTIRCLHLLAASSVIGSFTDRDQCQRWLEEEIRASTLSVPAALNAFFRNYGIVGYRVTDSCFTLIGLRRGYEGLFNTIYNLHTTLLDII